MCLWVCVRRGVLSPVAWAVGGWHAAMSLTFQRAVAPWSANQFLIGTLELQWAQQKPSNFQKQEQTKLELDGGPKWSVTPDSLAVTRYLIVCIQIDNIRTDDHNLGRSFILMLA
jgi:hypothetical protein